MIPDSSAVNLPVLTTPDLEPISDTEQEQHNCKEDMCLVLEKISQYESEDILKGDNPKIGGFNLLYWWQVSCSLLGHILTHDH